jgi:hypothetical protein
VIGFAMITGGGWLIHTELARPATHAEIAAAGQAEVASRWERLTAGQMFQSTVGYTTSPGLPTSAGLVGIAPRSACAAATDSQLAAALHKQGCTAVLRATYTDSAHVYVLTAGIAVMPSPAAAQRAVANFGASHPHGGVKAVAFPGTVADVAGTEQNDWFGVFHAGPYVVMFAAGATDGQSVQSTQLNPALADLAFGVVRPLAARLAQGGNPCERQDVQC